MGATWMAADLHVHSALSPCAADEMRPPAILLAAELRGIGLLGIVDHNSAGNARAFLEAAEAFEVRVVVGLEVESSEGVHALALFDRASDAEEMERALRPTYPPLANRPDWFGAQLLVDEMGDVVGEESRLLAAASSLDLEEILRLGHRLGGFVQPAHVDRQTNGLLAVLGLLPPALPADALEVSASRTRTEARERWPELAGWTLTTASDAHCLDDIGRATTSVPRAWLHQLPPTSEWGALLGRQEEGRRA